MRPRALTRSSRAVAVGAALIGLVLSSAACNAGRPPAARVDGTEIPVERLDALLAAYLEADPDTYRSLIEGEGEDTYQMVAASQVLNSLVLQVLQSGLAEQEGAFPSEEEQTEAEELVRNSFAEGAEVDSSSTELTEEQAQAQEDSAAVFDLLTEDVQDWLIGLRADTLALSRVAQDRVAASGRSDDDPMCLRVIVVDEADVAAVQQRLEDGEDFGAVSSEVTIDADLAAAGGSLGEDCLTVAEYEAANLEAQFVAVIDELDFGEVSDPIDIGDGAVAIFEARQDPEAALAELVAASIDDIDVSIDPRFGTWDAETGTITPPDGARAPDTTTTTTTTTTAPAGTETTTTAPAGAETTTTVPAGTETTTTAPAGTETTTTAPAGG